MKRSEFFAASLAVLGLGLRPSSLKAARGIVTKVGPIPHRPLGRTGENLSVIGFGGNIIKGEEPAEAARMLREAFENGVNYYDVAPAYGNAEVLMGPPLEPFRKEVFLSCKTEQRDAEGSRAELERSLQRLHTDYFDLYQLHHITSREDIDQAFGPGGVMETLDRAKKDGLARFLGFSAHSVEAAFAAIERYEFDTIMFPVNYICHYKGNFGPQVIEKAREKGLGILALKPGARCLRAQGEEREYRKCWYRPFKNTGDLSASYRYTLSQPVTAALTPQVEPLFKMALDAAKSYVPLSEAETKALMSDAAGEERPLFVHPTW